MRSSKSRSRSKSNRPRTLGNITNRVFDSSGPEGKVRGTPQQIIEKYVFLARDAQLSNDRVNAENFLQHAEHYTRMLGEAQRELMAEQEQRRAQDQQNQPRDRQERNDRGDGQQPDIRMDQRGDQRPDPRNDTRGNDQRIEPRSDDRREQRSDDRREPRSDDRRDRRSDREAQPAAIGNDVIDLAAQDDDIGLVETPEARRPQRVRQPKPSTSATGDVAVAETSVPVDQSSSEDAVGDAPGAEKPARGPRRPRGPRKPKADEAGAAEPDSGDPRAAAE